MEAGPEPRPSSWLRDFQASVRAPEVMSSLRCYTIHMQEVTWYEGEPPALLLGVVIRVEDGSQPALQDNYNYLMCNQI